MNLLIISSANTSSQPNAVMIKLHDTVIADIAMGGASWTENVTRFTKFELEHNRRVHQAYLQIVDA